LTCIHKERTLKCINGEVKCYDASTAIKAKITCNSQASNDKDSLVMDGVQILLYKGMTFTREGVKLKNIRTYPTLLTVAELEKKSLIEPPNYETFFL